MSRVLFGAVAATLLIGISYFSAKMYTLGFRWNSITTMGMFFAFLVIALLFVLSIVLARSGSSAFGSLVYAGIQIATGFGFYLFLGAIVLSLLMLVSAIGSFALPSFIAGGAMALSLTLGVIGLIQARFIQTVEYTVTLSGAPTIWNGKTAVLISDTHFGIINKKQFSDKVVQKIISLNPNFVLHAGDFYDGPAIDTGSFTASWKHLTERFPVFYAPGNHEEYGNYAGFIASVRDAGVVVLEDKKVTYDGVDIAGLRYRTKAQTSETGSVLAALALTENTPSIVISHPPTFQQELAHAGADLLVSGHTHRGQFWPLNFLVRALYGTYYYGTSSFEGLQTVTTSGVGTFGPPFRLFNTPEIVILRFLIN